LKSLLAMAESVFTFQMTISNSSLLQMMWQKMTRLWN